MEKTKEFGECKWKIAVIAIKTVSIIARTINYIQFRHFQLLRGRYNNGFLICYSQAEKLVIIIYYKNFILTR